MAQFPTLYGEAVTGKTKVWSIRVHEQGPLVLIETEYGFEDGKKQIQTKYVTEGKNIGKKNETTPLQQAINEARATWIKKRESGYAPRGGEAVAVAAGTAGAGSEDEKSPQGSPLLSAVDLVSRGKASDLSVPSPMLAHSYQERKHNIRWPCYVQPKLDGMRCLGLPSKGLFSRQRKPFRTLAHIQAEVDRFPANWILDGELYSPHLTFQEITSIVKKEKPTAAEAEKQKQIQFHVYDVIMDCDFRTRIANLTVRMRRMGLQHLVLVKTESCADEAAMKEKHAEYTREGFEGIMLRNADGLYKQTRSAELQKYKEFFDAEYEITGFTEGSGPEEGCVVWICQTEDGQTFHCRPRGTREERAELFQHGDDYVGLPLTVRYQELTDDGKPRFPVGLAIRDYE
jgi:DNA ligase-1